MSKTCILVLGTPHSGTSVFSRLLNLSGAAAPRGSVADKTDCERGFRDAGAIAELNDMLLAACDSSWDDWRPLDAEKILADYGSDLVTLIAATVRALYDDAETIVLTDPRISRFVPLYVRALNHLGYRIEFLHALRDPRAVAASLAARNDMSARQACLLWMRHQMDAESATRYRHRSFYSYDDLMLDWRPLVARMRHEFTLPQINETAADPEEIEKFLSPDLQHHTGRAPLEEVGEETAVRIDEISALLTRLCSDPADQATMQSLDSARSAFERLACAEKEALRISPADDKRDEGTPDHSTRALHREKTHLEAQLRLGKCLQTFRESETAALREETSRLRTEKARLQSQLNSRETREHAALEIARELELNLCKARKRPSSSYRQLLKFRILRALSKDALPLPSRMKTRFRKSAAKVNPKRSLLAQRFPELAVPSGHARGVEDKTILGVTISLKEEVRASADQDLEAFLASDARVRFSNADHPRVSVILVLWNQAGLTLRCLRSLEAETDFPVEVIIVDNCSTDRTAELLERVDNARLLSQDENLGFLKAVNLGLKAVRGGHVLLLNNDAIVRPGSLAAAVKTIEEDATAGAVGGPIVLPDGTLQEAGSIIWADGSCLGYGRGDDPAKGAYNFRREVDYCSGAFLLVRKGVFQQLGGFDPDFAPAYYEESDLCMRIRRAGMKVIFEPRAIVDHFEFASSESLEQAIDIQKINRQKFLNKHKVQLRGHHSSLNANPLLARMRDDRERILYIEDRIPIVSLGSGFPRSNSILRLMVEAGYFVTFFPTATLRDAWAEAWSVVPEGVEVAMGVGLPGLEQFLDERKGYYQQIFISRPHNMKELSSIKRRRPDLFEGIKITYDAEALFSSRNAVKAEVLGDKALAAEAIRERTQELALVETADQVIAVTEAEADVFRRASGKPTHVLGYAVDSNPTPAAFSARKDILFVGRLEEEGAPNVDSLVWYVEKVLPLLDARQKCRIPLKAAGLNGAPSIRALDPLKVKLLGVVDDLDPLFDRARVFVAPTRFAAGIPLKVQQAAASGVPVVATSLLASQLGWSNERELLVADTPEAFSDAVYRLYTDPALWTQIRNNALQRIVKECSIEGFRSALQRALSPAYQSAI